MQRKKKDLMLLCIGCRAGPITNSLRETPGLVPVRDGTGGTSYSRSCVGLGTRLPQHPYRIQFTGCVMYQKCST